MAPKHDKAIVTLIVGDAFIADFMQNCLACWRAYAERHGYDLVALTELIDKDCDFERKSINWQALLIAKIPQLRDYKTLVWIDADILINAKGAPCIASSMTTDKIGVVDMMDAYPNAEMFFGIMARSELLRSLTKRQIQGEEETQLFLNETLERYYREFPPHPNVTRVLNLGVIVFDPKAHGDYLIDFYNHHPADFEDAYQAPLAYALQAEDRGEYLDYRFNVPWLLEMTRHYPFLFEMYLQRDGDELTRKHADLYNACVNASLRNSYFLHFAGRKGNPLVIDGLRTANTEDGTLAEMMFPGEAEEIERLIGLGYRGEEPSGTLVYL